MFSFDSTKFFMLATAAIFFVAISGCRTSVPPETQTVSDGELRSEIPFRNAEPEIFQAELVVRTGESERVTFIARNGNRRRTEFGRGTKSEIVLIETDRRVMMLPARRIYAEQASSAAASGGDFDDFLTTGWLSDARFATFEKLGAENGLTKYRVTAEGSTDSESFIFVDEAVGLPVRQEKYSAGDGERKLFYLFEIRGLRLETDESLFQIPAGFDRVTPAEFGKAIREAESKNE